MALHSRFLRWHRSWRKKKGGGGGHVRLSRLGTWTSTVAHHPWWPRELPSHLPSHDSSFYRRVASSHGAAQVLSARAAARGRRGITWLPWCAYRVYVARQINDCVHSLVPRPSFEFLRYLQANRNWRLGLGTGLSGIYVVFLLRWLSPFSQVTVYDLTSSLCLEILSIR